MRLLNNLNINNKSKRIMEEKLEKIKQLMKEQGLDTVNFYSDWTPSPDEEEGNFEYRGREEYRYSVTEQEDDECADAAVKAVHLEGDNLLFDVSYGYLRWNGDTEEVGTDEGKDWKWITDQMRGNEEWGNELLDTLIEVIEDPNKGIYPM